MSQLPCFGPPVYPYTDVDLPGYGIITNTFLNTVIESATCIYDQNKFNVDNAQQWTNSTEQLYVREWRETISRDIRDSYYPLPNGNTLWLNRVRKFLKATSDWSAWYNPKTKNHGKFAAWTGVLFDPVHWRIFANEWNGPAAKDKIVFNEQIADNKADFYLAQQWLLNQVEAQSPGNQYEDAYKWVFWWGQDGAADITLKNPPPSNGLEGFGVSQFLEWLTGLNYFELFAYEYSLVLFVALLSIAWTDFYPFFQEIGMIQ